jgi:hypothetical protein
MQPPGPLATAISKFRAAAIHREANREERLRVMQAALEEASLKRDKDRDRIELQEPQSEG